ncbi:MAG: LLM class flavin-dependent oxidoreductase, partial [Rhodospirillales bacterium]|nr:LLM class flavin-dependent oxidoreductase [Rhodospirillales bacterium]
EVARGRIAFYGSTQAYWPVLEMHGWGELGRKLNAMTREGKWAEMAREVPDEVVALFTAIGRHDRIAGAIAERFGPEIDAIVLPPGLPPDLLAEIAVLPSRFQGFRPRFPPEAA